MSYQSLSRNKLSVSREARERLEKLKSGGRVDTIETILERPSASASTSGYSVNEDIKNKTNEVQLQRSKSRVKQVEFELAVMKEVSEIRTQQLRDSDALVDQLKAELAEVKSTTLPAPPPQETGFRGMVKASQARMDQGDSVVDHDEVIELRGELEKTQNRLEDLEQERKIHLAKVSELLKMLQLNSASDIESELYDKAMRVAELECTSDKIRRDLEKSQDEVDKLKQEREANMNMVVELSKIISPDVEKEKVDEAIENLKAGKKLSTKHAQMLTIQQLKHQVETLEEEKSSFLAQTAALSKESPKQAAKKKKEKNYNMSTLTSLW